MNFKTIAAITMLPINQATILQIEAIISCIKSPPIYKNIYKKKEIDYEQRICNVKTERGWV